MNAVEFANWPSELTFEDWEAECKENKKRKRRLKVLCDKIEECNDALEVLEDEKGSSRYNRWLNDKIKYTEERDNLICLIHRYD